MCGIFGVLSNGLATGKLASAINAWTKQATCVGSLRGSDSTGMFQVSDKKHISSFKLPYEGFIFAMNREPQRMFSMADDSLVTVGHHRAATFGSVSQANAHPFEHTVGDRHIIGVHNGSLNGFVSNYDGRSFAVDSDMLMYKIAKMGGKEAIETTSGAMALVWYENDGKVRIYANTQRPLWWNYVPKENVMLFASESSMMHWLCDRNEIPLEAEMLTPEPDKIYTFDPMAVREYKTEVVDTKKPVVTSYTRAPARDWRSAGEQVPLLPGSSQGGTKKNSGNFGGAGSSSGPLQPDRRSSTFQGRPLFSTGSTDKLEEFSLKQGDIVLFKPVPTISQPPVPWEQMIGQVEWKEGEDGITVRAGALMFCVDETCRENILCAAACQGEIRARCIGTCELVSKGQPRTIIVLSRAHDIRYSSLEEQSDDDSPKLVIPGPKGDMTVDAFREATKDGCALCTDTIQVKDALAGAISWEPNSSGGFDYLCPNCTIPDIKAVSEEAAAHGYVNQ